VFNPAARRHQDETLDERLADELPDVTYGGTGQIDGTPEDGSSFFDVDE